MGPPGALAVLAFDSGDLNLPGLNAVTPTGFLFTVPVGDSETIYLRAGQYLYAKSSDPDVRLSFTVLPIG